MGSQALLPRGMFGLAAALGGATPDGAGPNIPWPRPDAMAGEGSGGAAKPGAECRWFQEFCGYSDIIVI